MHSQRSGLTKPSLIQAELVYAFNYSVLSAQVELQHIQDVCGSRLHSPHPLRTDGVPIAV